MPEWLLPASALSFTILVFIGGLGWKQATQFSNMKSSIYDKLEKTEKNILNKLEYHERHDDTRFSDIKNDIWMLRLRSAATTGLMTEEEHDLRQERRDPNSSRGKL